MASDVCTKQRYEIEFFQAEKKNEGIDFRPPLLNGYGKQKIGCEHRQWVMRFRTGDSDICDKVRSEHH